MNKCIMCGSYAINHNHHGRDGSDPDLCDVCYWRKRAENMSRSERVVLKKTPNQGEEAMASKAQKAKEEQHYSEKPLTCSNCRHYASDKIEHDAAFSWSKPYVTEKNKRCTIGGFSVKSMAWCELHVLKWKL